MLTMLKTVSTQLDTPQEIAAYLRTAANDGLAEAGFAYGDVVRITDRTFIPDGMAVGDVGVVLAGSTMPGQLIVLCATAQGVGLALVISKAALSAL